MVEIEGEEKMKKRLWTFLLLLTIAVLASLQAFAKDDLPQENPSQETSSEKLSGWVKKKGKTYFYKDGKKASGWQKIDGSYYYFKGGIPEKNKIVGSKKDGWYYVDPDGVRIKDKQIAQAVQFVMKRSNASHSAKARLRACYNALRRYPYVRIYGDKPAPDKIPLYANYMFSRRGGNCYRYGAASCYIARVLGFDVRFCSGGTTASPYRSLSPHGWCEVWTGDRWGMIDCSMGRVHRSHDLFLISRGRYPFRLSCYRVFPMKIKNHEIVWK